jgi:DNA-binding transcriptional LysR family regulator
MPLLFHSRSNRTHQYLNGVTSGHLNLGALLKFGRGVLPSWIAAINQAFPLSEGPSENHQRQPSLRSAGTTGSYIIDAICRGRAGRLAFDTNCRTRISVNYGVIWHKQVELCPAAQAFLQLIQSEFT